MNDLPIQPDRVAKIKEVWNCCPASSKHFGKKGFLRYEFKSQDVSIFVKMELVVSYILKVHGINYPMEWTSHR